MPTKKETQVLPVLLITLFLLFFFPFRGSPTGNATEDIAILGEEVTTGEIPPEEGGEETIVETTGTEAGEEAEAVVEIGAAITETEEETGTTSAETEMSEEGVAEEAAMNEVFTDMREQEEAVSVEEDIEPEEIQEEQPETITVAAFMEDTIKSPNNVVVVIGEDAPTQSLIIALNLAGKWGFHVVKDSAISELSSVHAISLGPASVNEVSAAALEQGAVASDESAYFMYENAETDSAVLVVAGQTPQETRRAVKELLKY